MRAAVAGDGEADLGGGTVLVVREALDQQRRTLRAAAFVHDLGVVDDFAGEAGAALDGAVDVVSGDRGLLGLGDGQFQARVAGEVRRRPCARATSMFLISLANDLARRLSRMAFLCLVVAHLEWPDMLYASPLIIRINSSCTRFSPVTSGWKEVASSLPERTATILAVPSRDSGWPPRKVPPGEDLHAGADAFHPRRADEHRVDGGRLGAGSALSSSPAKSQVRLEGVALAAERVAAHHDVDAAEGLLGLPARSVAGSAMCWPAGSSRRRSRRRAARSAIRRLQRIGDAEGAGELVDRGGFAAGQHQPVQPVQLLRTAHGHRVRSLGGQGRRVFADIALQGQDTDFQHESSLPPGARPGVAPQISGAWVDGDRAQFMRWAAAVRTGAASRCVARGPGGGPASRRRTPPARRTPAPRTPAPRTRAQRSPEPHPPKPRLQAPRPRRRRRPRRGRSPSPSCGPGTRRPRPCRCRDRPPAGHTSAPVSVP